MSNRLDIVGKILEFNKTKFLKSLFFNIIIGENHITKKDFFKTDK